MLQVPDPPYRPVNKFTRDVVPYEGAEFHTTFWPVPEDVELKGRIVFVHGLSEYSDFYVMIFDELVMQGYEIFFFDQRGSGWTSPEETRGITNEFHVFDDLDFFLKRNLDEVKGKTKLILGGHSMGGGIILNYGITGKYRDQISSIFTSGPCITLHPNAGPPAFVVSILRIVAKLCPNKRHDTHMKVETVTHDETWQKWIKSNPLLTPCIGTLGQLEGVLTRGSRLLNPEFAGKFNKPVLIILGRDDEVNDPNASKKFIDLISTQNKELVLVDNCAHCCLLEAPEVYSVSKAALFRWLEYHA